MCLIKLTIKASHQNTSADTYLAILDIIRIHGKTTHSHITLKERNYLHTTLAKLKTSPTYLPHHPWLMPISQITNNSWHAKDLIKNQTVKITRFSQDKEDHYHLEFLP